MRFVFNQKRYRDGLLGAILLLTALSLLLWPEHASAAVADGLSLCVNVLLPSLFPFFVLSSLIIELGMSNYLGSLLENMMQPLFRVNGSCAAALVMGILGGYPVGARTAIQLYESGQCSKTEAERLLAFCNNCGPAFILGVVGAGIFRSSKLGVVLYLTHIASSLTVGLIFRFYKGSHQHTPTLQSPQLRFQAVHGCTAFVHSVTGAMQSTLNICAFVLFFSVVIRMLACSGLFSALSSLLTALFAPLGLTRLWAARLMTGFLEMTAGVSSLTDGPISGRLSMAAFMLGWAGLSVHCQVMAFSADSGLSLRTYMVGKFLHGILSALFISLLSRFLLPETAISVFLARQVDSLARMEFRQAFTLSVTAAWLLWLAFFTLAFWLSKKRGGKTASHRL